MALDLGEDIENIFQHSKEYDQGLGNIRKGAGTFVVARDGSGDFSTIKAALKALSSKGGRIQVKEGTYDENNIVIPYSNISIEGISAGTPIISLGNNNGILVNGKNNVIISNISFGGGNVTNRYAISLQNSFDCIIKENYFNQMVGLQMTAGSYRNQVRDNVFYAGDDCLIISGANRNVISGNQVNEAADIGIWVKSSGKNNIINGNLVFNCWEGIYVQSGANTIIMNNQVTNDDSGSYDSAVWIDSQGDRSIVTGNSLTGIGAVTELLNNGTNTQLSHNITE